MRIGFIYEVARPNANNLASSTIVRISIYFIRKNFYFIYLAHVKVSTRWIDVWILGENQANGDVKLLSNSEASVCGLYSVNTTTLLTENTKTNWLDEEKIQMKLNTMTKKDC
jgi:hypothetical protein